VPACGQCNSGKSNEATSWTRHKKTDKRRFLVRFVEVRAALMLAEPQRAPVAEDET